MKVEHSVEIDQPPSVVYDFLLDPEALPLWISNFVRMEHLEGEPGEVGSKSRHFYDRGGETIELEEEILENEENAKLVAKYSGVQFDMLIENNIARRDDHASVLTISNETTYNSLLLKICSPLLKKRSASRLIEDMEKLNDAIEELTEIEGD